MKQSILIIIAAPVVIGGCQNRVALHNGQITESASLAWFYSMSPMVGEKSVLARLHRINDFPVSQMHGSQVIEVMPKRYSVKAFWFDYGPEVSATPQGLTKRHFSFGGPLGSNYYVSQHPYVIQFEAKPGFSYTIDSYRAVREVAGSRIAPGKLCILEFSHNDPGIKLSPNQANVMMPPSNAVTAGCGSMEAEN